MLTMYNVSVFTMSVYNVSAFYSECLQCISAFPMSVYNVRELAVSAGVYRVNLT